MRDRTLLRRLGIGLAIIYGAAGTARSLAYLAILQTFPQKVAMLSWTLAFVATAPAAILPCALLATRWSRVAERVAVAYGVVSDVNGWTVIAAPRTPVQDSLRVVAPSSLSLLAFRLLAGMRTGGGPADAETKTVRPMAWSTARSWCARGLTHAIMPLGNSLRPYGLLKQYSLKSQQDSHRSYLQFFFI